MCLRHVIFPVLLCFKSPLTPTVPTAAIANAFRVALKLLLQTPFPPLEKSSSLAEVAHAQPQVEV